MKKDCLNACAIGTDGSNCQWRANNLTSLTTNYATCSPNLTTCPDNICDPLEEMGQQNEKFICPQDCSVADNIYGPHRINEASQQGIFAGYGLCKCDEFGKCTCGPHDTNSPKSKKPKKIQPELGAIKTMATTVNSNQIILPGQCGLSCVLLIVLCPILLTVVIVSLVVSRRKYVRRLKKITLSNDQQNGDAETDTLHDIPLHAVNTEFTFKSDGDPKWEFPRSQLVLDTNLGEGEFGKVVKGYATNIDGHAGVTTVAVKMLKTGANSVEMLALLSEFQLLQEVSHPNVIRLIGACTQESPLIIIEYAKHGSLRNYLRLSRKIESNGFEFSNGVEPVVVRDILSFAWQICKGMTYLTEIKVRVFFCPTYYSIPLIY